MTASSQRGVLLINHGTPDSPDVPAVRRYLAEFLSNPDIIHLPRGLKWFNRYLGRIIARFRAPHSAEMYRRIWTERGSPLGTITEDQTALLETELEEEYRVFYAMRYGRPGIAETLRAIEAAGIQELVVVPMYPQFSGTTTGTTLRELYGSLNRGGHRINVSTRNAWYDDRGYVYAQAKLIEKQVVRHDLTPDDTWLVFSAHGLPVSYVERGDPYPAHVNRTVELVTGRLGWPADRTKLTFQSRMGPAKWLEPNTNDVLAELAAAGDRRVLLCPISFTADCLETLEEIDVGYRREFEQAGGELYLCPALNTAPEFITALKSLVTRGHRPLTCWGEKVRPLLYRAPRQTSAPPSVDSLVMVGMSLENRVGPGEGPEIVHTDASAFGLVKRAQHEIPEALQNICANGFVHEAFLWNTCHRFEFYGWPVEDSDSKEDCIVARVQKNLFNGHTPKDLLVNVLCGAEAWQHLVRTVAGLNSGIPGDRDIIEQLLQAEGLAERAGTAGPMTKQLIAEAIGIERHLREETGWNRYDPSYCFAALTQFAGTTGLELADCRFLVVGGSSTSRSVLASLTERFNVPSRELALAYRGHGGGQIKLLRKAIGNGRRIRVQSYSDAQVLSAIADADVVVYGIDHKEPALRSDQLRDLRDFRARPLTILDFNTFGSTEGLDDIEGVTLVTAEGLDEGVRSFANSMCANSEFARAVDEAERWIRERAPSWHNPSSKPHRCPRLVRGAAPDRQAGEPVPVQDRWRTCVSCVEEHLECNAATRVREAS